VNSNLNFKKYRTVLCELGYLNWHDRTKECWCVIGTRRDLCLRHTL